MPKARTTSLRIVARQARLAGSVHPMDTDWPGHRRSSGPRCGEDGVRMWGPRSSAARVVLALVAAGALSAPSVSAQGVTGAALSGQVLAGDGAAIRGAIVRLRNASTGMRREALSRDDGRFHFENVPVGGPYELTARALGYEPVRETGLALHLGDRVGRTIVMRAAVARRLDEVVVREPVLRDAGAGGPAHTIAGDAARRLPLANRDFVGLLALAPQASGSALLSISGQHNRFNAIQVDGGAANDFFGLGMTPGAAVGARSLSLEAIEEIRILIAPFDVRQSGFSGGLINAVTRSGTNAVRGSAFASVAGAALVGTDAAGARVPTFRSAQYGLSVGGPIVRDRLHYFVVADLEARRTTYDVAPASDPRTGVSEETAERAARAFRDRFGFDPGGWDPAVLRQPNHNILLKLTWQPGIDHVLEVTHGWVNGTSESLVRAPTGMNGWPLSRSGSASSTSNMTTRLRAASARGAWTNELVASATTIGDDRQAALLVPAFLVQDAPGSFLAAGSTRGTQGTATDQRILELTDNVSWSRGAHVVTVGTQNQLVRIRDNFVLNGWGVWTFANVDSLERLAPSRYEVGLPVTPGSQRLDFTGAHVGAYMQDRWSPTTTLTLTIGARVDVPLFDGPSRNESLAADTAVRGIDTGRFPSGHAVLSPRVGFSWTMGRARSTMLRGGVGTFVSRPPYAWLNNAFNGTGLEQTSLSCTAGDGVPPPTTNLARLPTQCLRGSGQIPLPRVSYFDPGVRFPRAVKLVLGVDRQLGDGFTASLDASHTRTLDHLVVEDVNVTDLGMNAEGRAMYGTATGFGTVGPARPSVDFGPIHRFSNRSSDRSTAVTASFAKQWRNGGLVQGGYTWSRTRDVMSLSGLASLNLLQSNPIDGTMSDRRLRRSARDIPHNLVVAAIAPAAVGVTVSAFLRARSGTPFAYNVDGDANADGVSLNDLAYVPRDSSDITLTNPAGYRALDAYIEQSACLRSQRGRIMARNTCRNPSVQALDVRLAKRFDVMARGAELSVDVINLPNLLRGEWGRVRETASREAVELLAVQGWDAANDRPRYAVRTVGESASFPVLGAVSTTDGSLASRWRVQLGARFDY